MQQVDRVAHAADVTSQRFPRMRLEKERLEKLHSRVGTQSPEQETDGGRVRPD